MVREVVVEQGREAGGVGVAPRGSDRVLGGYLTRMVRRFARFRSTGEEKLKMRSLRLVRSPAEAG